MKLVPIPIEQKEAFNALAAHPLQSYEWGEFRKKTGITVIRKGLEDSGKLTASLQYTLHPLPFIKKYIGYLPKYSYLSPELLKELAAEGKEQNAILMQHEPLVTIASYPNSKGTLQDKIPHTSSAYELLQTLPYAVHPLFTKYTFILDLNKSEEELLANMHSKTRYNIKVAQKHGVVVKEDNSDNAFQEYLRLSHETTTRQKFFAHTPDYHKKQWQTFSHTYDPNTPHQLTSHLFTASFEEKVLTAWIIFIFNNNLYYPYGASSNEHREVMHSNAMMWEVIKFGKKLNLSSFDMWGSLGPTPNSRDPWYGFHRFKIGYGADLIEYAGSFDQVIDPLLYQGYKVADKARWFLLSLKK